MNAFDLGRGRDTVVAVVDIGSGTAGVAILSISKKRPARVLASGVSRISLEEKTAEQHRTAISQHIASAGESAMKMYAEAGHHAPVTSVYAIVHGPWSEGHSASATSEQFASETKITASIIAENAKKSLANAQSIDRSALYEATTIRVMLNGYPTADPVGKYAHNIEVTSLLSTMDASVKVAVQSAIEKIFPAATITWRSFARAIIALFREVSSYGQYIAVDMQSDSTQLISYHYGVFEQRAVPEGVGTILARLGTSAPEEILTNVRMLARDACTTSACEKVQQAMAIAESELVRIFGELLSQIATPRRVSNELLLITHPDLQTWLGRFFARIDFSQFTTTMLPFNVHTPSSIDMSPFVSGELPDVALHVGAALVNIELGE